MNVNFEVLPPQKQLSTGHQNKRKNVFNPPNFVIQPGSTDASKVYANGNYSDGRPINIQMRGVNGPAIVSTLVGPE